tara:strand:+ start:211 stop:3762 length:3552 start_codon:yes stop_codon:yes gene_type:complete
MTVGEDVMIGKYPDYKNYPLIHDRDFMRKLYSKLEFLNKIHGNVYSIEFRNKKEYIDWFSRHIEYVNVLVNNHRNNWTKYIGRLPIQKRLHAGFWLNIYWYELLINNKITESDTITNIINKWTNNDWLDVRSLILNKYINSIKNYNKNVAKAIGLEILCIKLSSQVELLPQQKNIRNFMGRNTPYNNLLIYHGTGSGKTCTAITIAENYRRTGDPATIILSPKRPRANFLKAIFDIKRHAVFQCTGNTYSNEILREDSIDDVNLSEEERLRRDNNRKNYRNQIISKNYEFWGYQEFSNYYNRLIAEELNDKDNNKLVDVRKEYIQKYFYNRLIIIDEAHNLRNYDGMEMDELENAYEMSEAYKFLLEIRAAATNVKIVLMTATPMYDVAKEIWQLMRLLDGESNEEPSEENKMKELKRRIKGKVSYLRGKDPYGFPVTIYPSLSSINKMDGCVLFKLHSDKKIEYINTDNIVRVELDRNSLVCVGSRATPNTWNIVTNYEKKYNLQIVNGCWTYTNDNNNNIHGKPGLLRFLNKPEGRTQASLINKNKNPFTNENLSIYSPKIKTILNMILNSKGVVLVYSNFRYGGIIPLAIALENHGVKRFGSPSGANLTNLSSFSKSKSRYSYALLMGDPHIEFERDGRRSKKKKKKEVNDRYDYDDDDEGMMYRKNLDDLIMRTINDPSNQFGDKIKFVLVTNAAAEGVDFKYMREVHIMEPWHNLSRIKQTTGRAVRQGSHSSFELAERNVTIYYHVLLPPNKNDDMISTIPDIYTYARAIIKDISIAKYERILIENSIDCSQYIAQYAEDSVWNNIKIYDSQYNIRTILPFEFPVSFKCAVNENENQVIDKGTYNPLFHGREDVFTVVDIIKEEFTRDYSYYENQLIKSIKMKNKIIDDINICAALRVMVLGHQSIDTELRERITCIDRFGARGHIIKEGNCYNFVPFESACVSKRHRDIPPQNNFASIPVFKLIQNKINEEPTINVVDTANINILDKISENLGKLLKFIKMSTSTFDSLELKNPNMHKHFILYVLDRLSLKQHSLIKTAILNAEAENESYFLKYKLPVNFKELYNKYFPDSNSSHERPDTNPVDPIVYNVFCGEKFLIKMNESGIGQVAHTLEKKILIPIYDHFMKLPNANNDVRYIRSLARHFESDKTLSKPEYALFIEFFFRVLNQITYKPPYI